ncbi:CPBP family intramembrane glutamic endopeptidase [Echinicola salinicaeni]|uniref:CPBP family intramembrane glutamic endopeptidase n=1 Tax=Echinicola salinicaeni TaxID=2762757 RepID=UPI003742E8EE
MKLIDNFHLFLLQIHRSSFLLSLCVLNILFCFLISILFSEIGESDVAKINYLEEESLTNIFLFTVIIAPFLETFLFQFLIIETVLFIFNKFRISHSIYFAIAISSLAFGLSHSYNLYYVLFTLLAGVLYASFYLLAKKRHDLNGYLTVVLIHACTNFFGFILMDVLKLNL